VIWWTEMTGLDSFRLDKFPYSSRHFWSAWHIGLFRDYPHIFSIGEVSDGDPTVTAFFQGGRKQFDGIDSGVTTVFDFPMMYTMRDVIARGEPMQKLVAVLQRDWIYPHPELLVTFIGNHDNKRFLNEQGSNVAKLKAAYSLLLTLRGIPQLYYGDEIAMTGGDDPDNRHDFPGGFPQDQQNAFTAAGRTPEERDMFDFVKSLLALRAAHPALRDGSQTHIKVDDKTYAFLRSDDKERVLVVYNNSDAARQVDLDLSFTPMENATTLTPLLQAPATTINAKHVSIQVAPFSIAVYSVK